MAKRSEWTQVSDLVGRLTVSIAQGKPGEVGYIPKTDGFTIEVRYESQSEKMQYALQASAVAYRGMMKRYYASYGRWPHKPGVLQKVKGNGEFTPPVTIHMDRLEAQAKAGELDRDDRIRLAKIAGLTDEQIAMLFPAETTPESTETNQGKEGAEKATAPKVVYKYVREHLNRAKDELLLNLAQEEGLEGIEDMTRHELIEELALVEK